MEVMLSWMTHVYMLKMLGMCMILELAREIEKFWKIYRHRIYNIDCDDDFYLPSALCSCIKYLLAESEYSSCGGRALGLVLIITIYGLEVYPKLKGHTLNQDSPLERIYNHFNLRTFSPLFSNQI